MDHSRLRFSRSPYSRDPSILGSILGPAHFWKLPHARTSWLIGVPIGLYLAGG